jgi:PAS domain S-box-containing protein
MTDVSETSSCEAEGYRASDEECAAVEYRSDETYRIMADAMPQIVWSADAEGARDYYNQRWYEHTGLTVARTTGWGWNAALHPDDAPRVREAWQKAVPDQADFETEYRLLCAEDGSYRWYIERAVPVFDPQGQIIKWFGTCTDINELREAQKQIEGLNIRLRRAMTETHHRVKNNLQIISAMVDMQLMNDQETISAEEFRRLGSHVRTLAAVHDILTHESKETDPNQAISVKEVLEKLLPIHQQTAPRCRITARIDDVALPGRQGTSLALVVNELISNAIKHGKGQIEIVVGREADDILVSVCDDGPGFPSGFSAQTAANTGLELILSLVEWDLAGRIEFANQPQGGAQVTLTLPSQRTH